MKKVLLLIALISSFQIIQGQSLQDLVSNHVFVYCNKDGSKMNVNGNNMYVVFHSNKTANLLIGSSLDNAMKNGMIDLGGWHSNEPILGLTWKSNPNTTKIYTPLFSGSKNLKSLDGDVILKNIFNF